MSTFIPEQSKTPAQNIPYFDDVTSDPGWQGHTTKKSMEVLKSEVMIALSRLGAIVTGFQRGTFEVDGKERDGFQVQYVVEQPGSGEMRHGRLDVAALPVKRNYNLSRSLDARRERSLKMALFMLREALNGTWFLSQLSPGYAPLMPWMLAQGQKTVTQLWSESVFIGNLLPSGQDFVEAEIEEVR